MKQTAVEWLLNNLISEPYTEADFKYNKECWNKAEEMEKEQIMDAFDNGAEEWCDGFYKVDISSQQYYKETFKSE
jgi:hypothetical protein